MMGEGRSANKKWSQAQVFIFRAWKQAKHIVVPQD
jgi:hypothetical protein